MNTRKVKVLLVEDDPADVALTLRTLRSLYPGDTVAVVGDGSEAIDFLLANGTYSHRKTEELPDLVLLDLRLPKVGGIQALQWLRADKRTQALPVAILTGLADDRSIAEVHRLGVLEYIPKPLSRETLTRVVGKLPLRVEASP